MENNEDLIEELQDVCYELGRQNYCLFHFLTERGLVQEWNAFYPKMIEEKNWSKEW